MHLPPDCPMDRHTVHAEVRRAIDAIVELGDLSALHPIEAARVGIAAAQFADTVTAVTRRRNSAARRGKRGTQRGRGTAPGGDAA